MASPSGPLQTAVYARLIGDATLVALVQKIGDNIPDEQAYPYIVIGEETEAPEDTMGRTGRNLTITLHVWSQYPGMKEVKEIMSRIDDLLDRWTPTVTGWNATEMLHDFADTLRDPDGKTRHGVVSYRIHAHE